MAGEFLSRMVKEGILERRSHARGTTYSLKKKAKKAKPKPVAKQVHKDDDEGASE